MSKVLIKILLLLSFLLIFAVTCTVAQTIKIGNVSGTYGQGSTIAVPFEVTDGCVPIGNIYSLYISDNTGNFPASPAVIDTLQTFYATFFNFSIPKAMLPGTYKFIVTSSSPGNPTISSAASGSFTVNAVAGVQAAINSPIINSQFPYTFGNCVPTTTPFVFTNASSTTNVTATFFNEQLQQNQGGIINLLTPLSFIAATANYTIVVTATGPGGIIGTKAYQLINNSINSALGSSNNAPVCLSNGFSLFSFYIDPTATGILNNYPGNIYTVSWGDGLPSSSYTACQLIQTNGIVTHTYKKPSCGNDPNGQPNTFEIVFQPESPYCGYGARITSYVKVLGEPINIIGGTVTQTMSACTNTAVTFQNISDPGEDPTSTTNTCTNVNALYTWTVDNKKTFVNYTLTQPLIYTFTTPGEHTVTLHLQPGEHTLCPGKDTTIEICVQNPPLPKFKLSDSVICAPQTITTTDLSVVTTDCSTANQYVWTVNGPAGFNYIDGTSNTSKAPKFQFHNAGVYTITLGINSPSCGLTTTNSQTIVVDSAAVAQLSPNITICGDRTLAFDSTASPSHVVLNGQNPQDTYLWTISGDPNYTFQNSSTKNSKYPVINFTDTSTYTITVVHTNQCGLAATSTQNITFKNSPIVTAGTYPVACPNSPISLSGKVTEPNSVKSLQWIADGGPAAFSAPNSLNTTYTPTAADIKAGYVKFTLQAISKLPAPCDMLTDTTTVSILPADSITSVSAASICSGTALNYKIAASIPGSTFSWTVKATLNAKISPAGTSGNIINDVIASTDTGYAVVTYTITPQTATCSGAPYTLTVTVAPTQATASFIADNLSGCGNLTVNFKNTSKPYNSNYSWNFGDGTTSTNANPSHVFQPALSGNDTTYTVTLNIVSNCITATPATLKVTVRPTAPNAAIFPANGVFSGCSPFVLTVDNFTADTNKSYRYFIYKSDGKTLVQDTTVYNKNPVTFRPLITNTSQQFILYMSTENLCGTADTTKHIYIAVSSQSIFAGMQPVNSYNQFANTGCAPLNLSFVNLSVGGNQYQYTIYDSSKTAIGQPLSAGTANYPYSFTNAGKYYVSITAINSCTLAPVTSTLVPVVVYAMPKASFKADTVKGCTRAAVNFTNLSSQVGVLYKWCFGDGSPDFVGPTPPQHIYDAVHSPYTVTLVATNPQSCSDTLIQTNLVTIIPAPAVNFSANPDTVISIPDYHFDFTDETTNNPVAWKWSFGDGTTSTLENPGHTYAYGDTGIHKVTLTAYNKESCDSTISHIVLITGVPGQLYMPNAFMPTSASTGINLFLAKGSGIKNWRLQVFNNYGQLIWETTQLDGKGSPVEGWDGTFKGAPAPQGAYIWQASATFINGMQWKGMSYHSSLPKTTGTVMLIR